MSKQKDFATFQISGWVQIFNSLKKLVLFGGIGLFLYYIFAENWFTLEGLNLWKLYLVNIDFRWFAGYSLGFYYVFNKLFSKLRIFVDGYELVISGMNVKMKEVYKTTGKSILVMDGKSLDVFVEDEYISDDPIIFQGLLGRKFNVEAIRDLFVDHEILRRNFAENVSGLTKKILEEKLKPQVKDVELWKPRDEGKSIELFTPQDADRDDDDGRITRRIRDVFKKSFRRERFNADSKVDRTTTRRDSQRYIERVTKQDSE